MELYYQNSKGEKLDFTGFPYLIKDMEELLDFSRDYDIDNGKISFSEEPAEVSLVLNISAENQAEYHAAVDNFYDITEYDVANETFGRLYYGGQYVECYLIGSQKKDWYFGVNYMMNHIRLVSLRQSWITEQTKQFLPLARQKDAVKSASGTEIVLSDASDKPIKNIIIDGYTQQDGEPSPDAPQQIQAVGQRGFFDGKWVQGYYLVDNGNFGVADNFIVTEKLRCNGGDEIRVKSEQSMTQMIIMFWQADGTYMRDCYLTVERTNTIGAVAPAGAGIYVVRFIRTGLTPANVGNVTITMNGSYAVPVSVRTATQAKTTYVPVAYPLHDGERIALKDGRYKILRKWELYKMDTVDKVNRWYLSGAGQDYENTLIFAYQFEDEKTDRYAQNTETVLCTHNKAKNVYTADTPGFYVVNPSTSNDNRIYFRINKSSLKTADLAGFKMWLEENEPEFLLELIVPTYEEIEQAPFSGIRTSYPVTNMSADGGNLTVTYYEYTGDGNYDYSFDYPFDFQGDEKGSGILHNAGNTKCDFKIIIYGPCLNPRIMIGGHVCEVLAKLDMGEYMVIDSRARTVKRVRTNGMEVNEFDNRRKGESIFDRIPQGNNLISWDGTFGFDIILFHERGEPIWS